METVAATSAGARAVFNTAQHISAKQGLAGFASCAVWGAVQLLPKRFSAQPDASNGRRADRSCLAGGGTLEHGVESACELKKS